MSDHIGLWWIESHVFDALCFVAILDGDSLLHKLLAWKGTEGTLMPWTEARGRET